MPAISVLTISAATPWARALAGLAGRAGRGLKRLAERVKNRRDAMRLAELDDRMLADIGLSRIRKSRTVSLTSAVGLVA